MPVKSYVLGAGTLEISDLDDTDTIALTAQITSCKVQWTENVTAGETVELLSGDQLTDEDEVNHSAVLTANLVQDIDAGGSIEYSWTNRGLKKHARFVPNTVEGREVTGTVTIVPIDLGGDVKKRNRSDISWRFDSNDLPALADVGP